MKTNKKSTKKATTKKATKFVKLAEAYAGLADALETEKMNGKNYRAIQKYLTILKKRGFVTVRCNSKKEVLIAEAKRVLDAREAIAAKFAAMDLAKIA